MRVSTVIVLYDNIKFELIFPQTVDNLTNKKLISCQATCNYFWWNKNSLRLEVFMQIGKKTRKYN